MSLKTQDARERAHAQRLQELKVLEMRVADQYNSVVIAYADLQQRWDLILTREMHVTHSFASIAPNWCRLVLARREAAEELRSSTANGHDRQGVGVTAAPSADPQPHASVCPAAADPRMQLPAARSEMAIAAKQSDPSAAAPREQYQPSSRVQDICGPEEEAGRHATSDKGIPDATSINFEDCGVSERRQSKRPRLLPEEQQSNGGLVEAQAATAHTGAAQVHDDKSGGRLTLQQVLQECSQAVCSEAAHDGAAPAEIWQQLLNGNLPRQVHKSIGLQSYAHEHHFQQRGAAHQQQRIGTQHSGGPASSSGGAYDQRHQKSISSQRPDGRGVGHAALGRSRGEGKLGSGGWKEVDNKSYRGGKSDRGGRFGRGGSGRSSQGNAEGPPEGWEQRLGSLVGRQGGDIRQQQQQQREVEPRLPQALSSFGSGERSAAGGDLAAVSLKRPGRLERIRKIQVGLSLSRFSDDENRSHCPFSLFHAGKS